MTDRGGGSGGSRGCGGGCVGGRRAAAPRTPSKNWRRVSLTDSLSWNFAANLGCRLTKRFFPLAAIVLI